MLLRIQEETIKKLYQAPDSATEVVAVPAKAHLLAVTVMDEAGTRETVSMLRRFHLGDPDASSRFQVPDVSH